MRQRGPGGLSLCLSLGPSKTLTLGFISCRVTLLVDGLSLVPQAGIWWPREL